MAHEGSVMQSAYWESVGQLWERATGGGDVAAKPDAALGEWPTAARPPGVSEAVDWFTGELHGSGVPKLLFLVGGPGAGKSHASASIVAGLTEVEPRRTSLAYRSYRYATANRDLLLINDATIGSDEHSDGALSADINQVIASGRHLAACINRGVLVEEVSLLEQKPQDEGSPGGALVNWLHQSQRDVLVSTSMNWAVETSVDKEYLRCGTLFEGNVQVAQVLAVFVDVCSLLEQAPRIEISQVDVGDFIVLADDYSIEEFPNRADFGPKATPAASLFTAVMEKIGYLDRDRDSSLFDPISANLKSLTSPAVRNGVQSILRAAEIAGSQRLTYRELWGAIARCVVGDATDEVNAAEIRDHIAALQPKSDKPVERFREIQRLAGLRFSQALVGAGHASSNGPALKRNPVTRLTSVVDPVRDAIPGVFDGSLDSGWATSISDAFGGHVDSGSPLIQILEGLDDSDPFCQSITDFDRALDTSFAAASRSPELKDGDRYSLIAWYGGYLMRLYAISKGIPAFRREVSSWTLAWFMSPTLPRDLEDQLKTLLKPARYPERGNFASLIPVYESRTNPVVGEVSVPQLALRAGSIEMTTEVRTDSLFLKLEESNRQIPPIVLDFPLMREALACGSGHSGVTEVSDITSPRLERFRAARLVPGSRLDTDNYRVVFGAGDDPLNVGGRQ
jgi:hypothetical protein